LLCIVFNVLISTIRNLRRDDSLLITCTTSLVSNNIHAVLQPSQFIDLHETVHRDHPLFMLERYSVYKNLFQMIKK